MTVSICSVLSVEGLYLISLPDARPLSREQGNLVSVRFPKFGKLKGFKSLRSSEEARAIRVD